MHNTDGAGVSGLGEPTVGQPGGLERGVREPEVRGVPPQRGRGQRKHGNGRIVFRPCGEKWFKGKMVSGHHSVAEHDLLIVIALTPHSLAPSSAPPPPHVPTPVIRSESGRRKMGHSNGVMNVDTIVETIGG